MVALRRVRPDRPALPAVAVRGSGSGPPAEEGPQEKPHRVMKGAAGDVQPRASPLPDESGWTHGLLLSHLCTANGRREVEALSVCRNVAVIRLTSLKSRVSDGAARPES